MVNAASGIYTI